MASDCAFCDVTQDGYEIRFCPLHAAAPALLAALQAIMANAGCEDQHGREDEWVEQRYVDQARAAIAQAEGA